MGVKSRGCHREGLLKNGATARFRISAPLESADFGPNLTTRTWRRQLMDAECVWAHNYFSSKFGLANFFVTMT